MKICVVEPILTQKNTPKYLWKTISMIYNADEKFVARIHIYGARNKFLPFFYHQDTESESREMGNSVA